MTKKTRPISELDAKMDPAVLERARRMAAKESLNIRLPCCGKNTAQSKATSRVPPKPQSPSSETAKIFAFQR